MPEKTDTKQCALDRKLPGLGWISLQRGCELQVHVTSGLLPTPPRHNTTHEGRTCRRSGQDGGSWSLKSGSTCGRTELRAGVKGAHMGSIHKTQRGLQAGAGPAKGRREAQDGGGEHRQGAPGLWAVLRPTRAAGILDLLKCPRRVS